MMNKHLTHQIRNGLRDAFHEARSSQVGSGRYHEIRFERMIYNKERNLVVVEIGQEQLLDLPKSSLDGNAIKKALLEHLDCSRVDVMDLGESTYIYCWVAPMGLPIGVI
ncbi:MAG TPA: hypothetical protein VN843_28340 [Anaerolineales bacterium]|nr:hypothetical protein [Anaerolineales bacterium]